MEKVAWERWDEMFWEAIVQKVKNRTVFQTGPLNDFHIKSSFSSFLNPAAMNIIQTAS